MSFGISGSQRVGKTTLAKRVAERMNLPFVQTDVSGVFRKMGMNPAVNHCFEDRIRVQYAINEHFREVFSQHRIFVSDRTSLCSLAYVMTDIRQVDEWDKDVFEAYIEDCFEIINKYFSTIVVVQPGIQVQDPGGKLTATGSHAFMELMNTLVNGISLDKRCGVNIARLARSKTNLDQRVNDVSTYFASLLESNNQLQREVTSH